MKHTTKTEVSAGGLVVRKTNNTWEVLILMDKNDAWTFPKGKLEQGEEAIDAAKREIQEEVGVSDLTILGKLPVVRYMYTRDGLISKTVHYFVFESAGTQPLVSQAEEGLHDAQWMPITQAINIIGYEKTNKPLLVGAQKILASRP